LICPTDPPDSTGTGDAWLAYLCNRGVNRADSQNTKKADNPAEGVCLNQSGFAGNTDTPIVTVGLGFLSSHDGATNTLLVAESLVTPMTGGAISPLLHSRSDPKIPTSPRWTGGDTGEYKMEVEVGFDWGGEFTKLNQKVLSRHSGGLNVAFCDGHAQFLRDNVSIDVYKQLMTPWGAGCTPQQTTILSDGSY
jgi:prepilin-type processing-associated H-X9-DG protein